VQHILTNCADITIMIIFIKRSFNISIIPNIIPNINNEQLACLSYSALTISERQKYWIFSLVRKCKAHKVEYVDSFLLMQCQPIMTYHWLIITINQHLLLLNECSSRINTYLLDGSMSLSSSNAIQSGSLILFQVALHLRIL